MSTKLTIRYNSADISIQKWRVMDSFLSPQVPRLNYVPRSSFSFILIALVQSESHAVHGRRDVRRRCYRLYPGHRSYVQAPGIVRTGSLYWMYLCSHRCLFDKTHFGCRWSLMSILRPPHYFRLGIHCCEEYKRFSLFVVLPFFSWESFFPEINSAEFFVLEYTVDVFYQLRLQCWLVTG